jgi:hypothetical protein
MAPAGRVTVGVAATAIGAARPNISANAALWRYSGAVIRDRKFIGGILGKVRPA